MDLALYDTRFGYYARSARRSGRAGDFFTSVDVGPLFGDILAIQLAEMFDRLRESRPGSESRPSTFDLVEAGAGNGRLSADVLSSLRRRRRDVYDAVALTLVEASGTARAAQRETLGDFAERLVASRRTLPDRFRGALFANELLDAMPVHQVVMRADGLREVYVEAGRDGRLAPIEGPPSTPALREYLDRVNATLEPGWRAEINLRAIDWISDAARRLERGFMILVDYGHEAHELYGPGHSAGTLTSFSAHRGEGSESGAPSWLQNAGAQDVTAHVDFTGIRQTAESEGMTTIGFVDQTYFVMGIAQDWTADELAARAAALKTLIMPGGLGSTQKVLILGKNVGTPALRGMSFSRRAT